MEEFRELIQEQLDLMAERVNGVERQNLQTRREMRDFKKNLQTECGGRTPQDSEREVGNQPIFLETKTMVDELKIQLSDVTAQVQVLQDKVEENASEIKDIRLSMTKIESEKELNMTNLSEKLQLVEAKQNSILEKLKAVHTNTQNISNQVNLDAEDGDAHTNMDADTSTQDQLQDISNDAGTPGALPAYYYSPGSPSTESSETTSSRRQSKSSKGGLDDLSHPKNPQVHVQTDERLSFKGRVTSKTKVICAVRTLCPPICTCRKEFVNDAKLHAHIKNSNRPKRFTCGQCSKRFPFLSQLKRHQLLTHGNKVVLRSIPSYGKKKLNVGSRNDNDAHREETRFCFYQLRNDEGASSHQRESFGLSESVSEFNRVTSDEDDDDFDN